SQGPGGLQIPKPHPAQVFRGRQPLDTVSVSLIALLIVPEPVFSTIREDDKWRIHIVGIPASLLLGVIRVLVLALGLNHAKHTTEVVAKQVIGATGPGSILELNLLQVIEVPVTRAECLIYVNTSRSFRLCNNHTRACLK